MWVCVSIICLRLGFREPLLKRDLVFHHFVLDLLAVRRVPLKCHPYLTVDGPDESSSSGAGPSRHSSRVKPDPEAELLMRDMQKIVSADRDLHEKVRSSPTARLTRNLSTHESF